MTTTNHEDSIDCPRCHGEGFYPITLGGDVTHGVQKCTPACLQRAIAADSAAAGRVGSGRVGSGRVGSAQLSAPGAVEPPRSALRLVGGR